MAAAATAALMATAPAVAQTVQVPLKVTSTLEVNEVCTVNGGAELTEVDFGTVQNPADFAGDLLGSNLEASGGISLSISCNRVVNNAQFSVSSGDNDQGGVRRLVGADSGSFIPYRLFLDAAATAVELTPGTPRSVGSFAANQTFTIPIYGRIANAAIRAAVNDTYTDAASGTLTF
jgi:spore coat protein U-like protein